MAEVTLNRVSSPQFPDTVCGVVHEKRFDALRRRRVGAFSWTELETLRQPRGRAWLQAMAVAITIYDRQQPLVVPGALHYHADSIEPRWAREKQPIATIGRHVFYR